MNESSRGTARASKKSVYVSKIWRCHYILSFYDCFRIFFDFFLLNSNLYECANQFDGGHLLFAAHSIVGCTHFFLSCNMSPVCLIFSYFGMTLEKINSPIRMTENLLCKLARFYVTREEIKEDD